MTSELLREGRYRITGKLGAGAQGETFDGLDCREGVPVAIKRFSVRGATSWKDVELAEREAAVLETLSHPLLPAHVDHFEEDGALYLVMQKIDGKSLAARLERGAALSREDVIRFLRDAGSVLGYLHGRSPPVFHRDINPKNIIRRPDGAFVLVDFGAVRDRLKPEGGSTVVGTYGYMAPEQFQGRALPQSDVYGVGATALRMITGLEPDKLPHRGLGIDVGAALPPGFDPALRHMLERMLDPDPDRRAPDVNVLLGRLDGESERSNRRSTASGGDARARRESESYGPREVWSKQDTHNLRNAARRAAREAAEAHRQQARAIAEQVRREVKRARRARRNRHAGRRLHGPPLVVALFVINVAMMAVALTLGVLVPTLLTLLSVIFGHQLREAAKDTARAGDSARESMRNFQLYLLYGTDGPPDRATASSGAARRVRVEDEPDVKQRVATEQREVVETTGADATDETTHER